MKLRTVDQWVSYIQTLHVREIDMGLDRVRSVWEVLGGGFAKHPVVITVAGTNGKGSTVAALESIYLSAGYRVACYTSPHLVRYNERIRLNGLDITDRDLLRSFETVEKARGDIRLTFFEFGTLAAFAALQEVPLDVIILEVGLGGRLDATNIVDADLSIITSIGLDHTDWLGHTVDEIAVEKAGVCKPGALAINNSLVAKSSIAAMAQPICQRFWQRGQDFHFSVDETGNGYQWQSANSSFHYSIQGPWNAPHQQENLAGILMAAFALFGRLPVEHEQITRGLNSVVMPSRHQYFPGQPAMVLDVSHNEDSIKALVDFLPQVTSKGKVRAIFSALSGKSLRHVANLCAPWVKDWYLASLEGERAQTAEQIYQRLNEDADQPVQNFQLFSNPLTAFYAAKQEADADELLLIFGSFRTVGAIIPHLD